jgi:hypothetical protein
MDALTTEKLCPGLIALGRETKSPKVVWVKALAGPATGDVQRRSALMRCWMC